jgi:hypothetical protein
MNDDYRKMRDAFMRKDKTIGIRVPAELKKVLTQIAKKEGRSLAQLCEMLLKEGASMYKEEGPKYLQRVVSRQNKEDSSG